MYTSAGKKTHFVRAESEHTNHLTTTPTAHIRATHYLRIWSHCMETPIAFKSVNYLRPATSNALFFIPFYASQNMNLLWNQSKSVTFHQFHCLFAFAWPSICVD